jgi:DNA-binding SARP family transcriptional activator/TolB-like protein
MGRDRPDPDPAPRQGLTIRLFGGMAVHDANGVDYLPRSRKTRAIVALLTLSVPRAVPRGEITALLWSQRGLDQGRASLRQAVHALQWTLGAFGKRILVVGRHSLTIEPHGATVDVLDAMTANVPGDALLRMFEGGLLEELNGLDPAFDVWLTKERRRFAAIARVAGEAFLDERHPREAVIRAARSLLRLDPTNRFAWHALIETHIQAGDRAAARFACEQWAEALGVAPDQPPPIELAGFLSRIRFGPRYQPEASQREWRPGPPMLPDSAAPVEPAPERNAPSGIDENVVVPERPPPIHGMRASHMPLRNLPGGATRDLAVSRVHPLSGVAEVQPVPLNLSMPRRDLPIGGSPTPIERHGVAENRVMPDSPMQVDAAPRDVMAPGSDDAATRAGPTLRLGIREMRVIGPKVDKALSPGLAEELTTALSRFHWISCVSGSSLAAIAGESGENQVRWPDLDLDLLLDGAIRRGPDGVRITVRLLDMRAGEAVVWANRFDLGPGDTLSAQEQVAAAVVAQLDPLLLIRESERAADRDPHGESAHELVLRAVPAIYRLDRQSFRAAGQLLEAALRTNPTDTDALSWYAYWHLFMVGQGWAGDPGEATRRAGELADAAVALDPNDARALALAGHVRGFLSRRPAAASVLLERAISLNPNLAIAWCFSGFERSYAGEHREALVRMEKAIELSPADPHLFFFQSAIIMPHLLLGQYAAAAAAGRLAIELNPWFSSSFKGYLAALGHLGETGEAANVLARLLNLEPDFTIQAAIRRSPISLPADIARYAEGLRLGGLPER